MMRIHPSPTTAVRRLAAREPLLRSPGRRLAPLVGDCDVHHAWSPASDRPVTGAGTTIDDTPLPTSEYFLG